MPIVDEMIENIQKRQHLYNNQLLSLSQLTDSYDNYEDLCKAIKDITQIDDRHRYSYDYLHLNNKLLAGLLFSKVNAALKKDIQIIVTIFNYDYTSNCSDMEIIDLAGVLIDNAIEACSPDDTIFISIGQRTDNIQSDSFRIKVENRDLPPQVNLYTISLLKNILPRQKKTDTDWVFPLLKVSSKNITDRFP